LHELALLVKEEDAADEVALLAEKALAVVTEEF
jgi:hypothetical protein